LAVVLPGRIRRSCRFRPSHGVKTKPFLSHSLHVRFLKLSLRRAARGLSSCLRDAFRWYFMSSERNVLDLVGKIYECAAEPAAWDDFLTGLARAAEGQIAAIVYHDDQRDEHLVSAQIGIPQEFHRPYNVHYGAMDEWLRGAPGIISTGWVGTGQMLVPDRKLAKSEFYNDYLRLNEDAFHLCAGQILQKGSALGVVSVVRRRSAGPFGESQLRLLRILLPHLQRAMQLHHKYVALRNRSEMFESAFDQVGTAIVFVDSKGLIIAANRAASALLDKRDGLIATREGLRATGVRESARLEKLIRAAACAGNGNGFSPGGALEITRQDPHSPLAVLVTPVRVSIANLAPHTPAAAVFITDREQRAEPSGEILCRLYGMTPAEYKLSILLAQGCSLREAADIHRVTIATVRSQLKSIFSKTNVHTQSQLVRLISLIPRAAPAKK
jgi:DNA-binding CsgD family transcriptional regulator/PAS domain-containing protein